eukprot:5897317-Amphidinium_carterae.1
MKDALLDIIVAGRRQRLEERERTRPTPKAPPHGVRVPGQQEKINRMSLQELRAQVRREDERIAQHQGGAYVSPPIPGLQLYRDRIDILETQLQEEEDRLEGAREQEIIVRQQEADYAVQEARRAAAELAEKEHQERRAREKEEQERLRRVQEQEELDRQAATAESPVEQVAQQTAEGQAAIPRIGENSEAQTVSSTSTVSSDSTGASTLMCRMERRDSEDYWKNIIDIMYDYFYDENDINSVQALHEGVLYWMNKDEIKNMETRVSRALSKDDPEAEKQYKWYLEENRKLEKNLREEYEKYHGAFEDGEDYQQALQDKDREAIKSIIFEYAAGVRERKLQWREYKIIENDKQKEAWKKEVLREQAEKAAEEQRTREGTTAAAASAASTTRIDKNYDKENPPKPIRPAPLPSQDRVPATPAPEPQPAQLSPRIQLKAENFKNKPGIKDDGYYEKRLFDEIRQRSYILQHPTSQYITSSPEIKRIYEGFETEDY